MDQNLDEETVRELQRELHVEILPGTEIMTDVGQHHFIKAGTGAHQVLVPQPSDDEHDPLNWSPFWKGCAIFTATLTTFTQGFAPLALAPMFGDLIGAFDSNLHDVIQFTGVAILVLGFSNFLWVPVMTTFGRRPTLIFSTLICLASSIWRTYANTYGSFYGASILNGIGAGPAETAQPAIIADIIFLHDRGKYNTLYFAIYFGSLAVGPIISGSMAHAVGWRNFWWLCTALNIFTILCLVFLFPETMYHRAHSPIASIPPPHASSDGTNSDEKIGAPLENEVVVQPALTHIPTHTNPYLSRGKPSKQQWKIWQLPSTGTILKSLAREFILPWHLHLFPIVEFASFVVSFSASVFLTLNLTQSQVFAAPPYNFTSQTIGFFNFAILIGQFIGLFTAGPLSDWIADRLTRRNRGIREPEMRLLAMIPYVFIMILGNIIVAVGYQQNWDWKAIVIVGYTCAGIQVAALPAISSTYAVDSYKPVAGSIFVAITVNKNVWGYGFGEFITPWTIEAGYIIPIMVNMTLTTVWCLFGVLFWYKGKTFRRWTKSSKVHLE